MPGGGDAEIESREVVPSGFKKNGPKAETLSVGLKHNDCVINPVLASRNIWSLGRRDPRRPVSGPQGRRAPRAGVRAGFSRRRGQGSGHGTRTATRGLESRGQGRGCRGAWRSTPPFQIELWACGPGRRLCLPSLARPGWAGWLQLIPGLGGGRGGSYARVHLGGLWAWAATHSGSACSPHILLFRRLYPLGCECLCPGARG